jgi:hypothetical protein
MRPDDDRHQHHHALPETVSRHRHQHVDDDNNDINNNVIISATAFIFVIVVPDMIEEPMTNNMSTDQSPDDGDFEASYRHARTYLPRYWSASFWPQWVERILGWIVRRR